MRIFLFIFFLSLAIFLLIASLKNWIKNEILDRLDKIGSLLSFLFAIAALLIPSDSSSQNTNTRNSPPISSPSVVSSPAVKELSNNKPESTPSVTNSVNFNTQKSSTNNLINSNTNTKNDSQEEIIETIREGETKRFFNNELILAVNDVYYTDSVSFTIGSTGYENKFYEKKPLSFVANYKAKHAFYIRVNKIDYVTQKAEFSIILRK